MRNSVLIKQSYVKKAVMLFLCLQVIHFAIKAQSVAIKTDGSTANASALSGQFEKYEAEQQKATVMPGNEVSKETYNANGIFVSVLAVDSILRCFVPQHDKNLFLPNSKLPGTSITHD